MEHNRHSCHSVHKNKHLVSLKELQWQCESSQYIQPCWEILQMYLFLFFNAQRWEQDAIKNININLETHLTYMIFYKLSEIQWNLLFFSIELLKNV